MSAPQASVGLATSPPTIECLLHAALNYHDRGWSIIPLIGKRPVLKRWSQHQNCRATIESIDRWFTHGTFKRPPTGIGIILGKVSGHLAARDFDEADVYKAWCDKQPELARTLPTVQTGRGFHVFFKSEGAQTRMTLGGEIRGEGSYVVAAPSLHDSGVLYKWVVDACDDIPEVDLGVFEITQESTSGGSSSSRLLESLDGLVNPETRETLVYSPALESKIRTAIEQTKPDTTGRRNRDLFSFARRLKSTPELAPLDGVQLRDAVRWWFEAAKPAIGTKDWDTTWSEFLYGWARVQSPFGEVMAEVVEAARSSPPPDCASRFESPKTVHLICICRELQKRQGDAPFYLAARAAGEAIGLGKDSANKLIQMLADEKILFRTYRGHSGRASEYVYLGDGEIGTDLRAIYEALTLNDDDVVAPSDN